MDEHRTNLPGRCRRLLIPIDARKQSDWCLRYAIWLAASGEQVEVCLIYVAEPVKSWEVLRFRTEQEISRFFRESADILLAEAGARLAAAALPCRTYFREADAVPAVLAAAEELGCSEIVVPRPDWLERFSGCLAGRLLRSAGSVPVTLVSAEGEPMR